MDRRALFAGLLVLALVHPSSSTHAQSGDPGDVASPYNVMRPPPNVIWDVAGNVTGCPAGDSVVAGHPCRLRITLSYTDANHFVKEGVPPESIYAQVSPVSGNIRINDERGTDTNATIYADDSTHSGAARISVPSFSGCGTVRVTLYVSGVQQGSKNANVRTVDTDADATRRVTTADQTGVCDLNYDGSSNSTDVALVTAHLNHWHHNTLFGTLVRRTNLCETCQGGQPNTYGEGDISWSPDGRTVAFSSHNASGNCSLKLVPSDPANGNTVTELTNPPVGVEDYDPQWSPLGDFIMWDRDDAALYKKDPSSPSNPDILIFQASSGGLSIATQPGLSPDGKSIAFYGTPPSGYANIWVVGTDGTGLRRLYTQNNVADQWPKWSPDGQTITFFRYDYNTGTNTIWTVPSAGGTPVQVLAPATAAQTPAYSSDGAVIVCGIGASGFSIANTFDPTLGLSAPPISAYPEFASFALWPRWSPDGTRLAMVARTPGSPTTYQPQLWAARRNMSRPPVISTVGGISVNDAHPVIDFTAVPGTQLNLVVNASDPDGDGLTYVAYFMRTDLGMSFSAGTQTFSWNAPAAASDSVYLVRFNVTTFSGGTDFAFARITVADRLPPAAVTDLSVRFGHTTAAALWTAPGDNGNIGNATAFDLRYSVAPIDEGNFSQAIQIPTGPPGPPGTPECADVSGLSPCNAYWFAVKTVDDAGNWSDISNVPSGQATCSGSLEIACAAPQDAAHPPAGSPEMPKVAELSIQGGNPTHDPIGLSFGVPASARDAELSLGVFDVAGRCIARIRHESAVPGRFTTRWDLRDVSGRHVSSGIYFVHFDVGRSRLTRSVLIVN
jgi:hypothetical protein